MAYERKRGAKTTPEIWSLCFQKNNFTIYWDEEEHTIYWYEVEKQELGVGQVTFHMQLNIKEKTLSRLLCIIYAQASVLDK